MLSVGYAFDENGLAIIRFTFKQLYYVVQVGKTDKKRLNQE